MEKVSLHVPVLRPESTIRMAWDIVVGGLALYSLFYIPVFTFFDHREVLEIA
jgi:hypothetical protein